VAQSHKTESWPELAEIRGGRLSDIPPDALEREFVHAFRGVIPNDTRFLRGESIGDLFDRVLPALPPVWRSAETDTVDTIFSLYFAGPPARPNIKNYHLLYGDHVRLARVTEEEQVFSSLERWLEFFLASNAREMIFLHAGVVGWRGGAVLFPGRSFSGKSTLVHELVRAGAAYYSDEFAMLDRRGLKRGPGSSWSKPRQRKQGPKRASRR